MGVRLVQDYAIAAYNWGSKTRPGFKNAALRPFLAAEKIAGRFGYEFSSDAKGFTKLAGTTKTGIVAYDAVTKSISSVQNAYHNYYHGLRPIEYTIDSTGNTHNARILMNTLLDRVCAVAEEFSDCAISIFDTLEFYFKEIKGISKEAVPSFVGTGSTWAGRVLYSACLIKEGRFVYKVWANNGLHSAQPLPTPQMPNPAYGQTRGTMTRASVVCACFRGALSGLFVALDAYAVLGNNRYLSPKTLEAAKFWTVIGIDAVLPFAVHLNRQVLEPTLVR